jgi:hypothetical protein
MTKGSRAGRAPLLRLSLLAWLPLVAALAAAAGQARAAVGVVPAGRGGWSTAPAPECVAAPVAARVRYVRRPRAPDAPLPSRAL